MREKGEAVEQWCFWWLFLQRWLEGQIRQKKKGSLAEEEFFFGCQGQEQRDFWGVSLRGKTEESEGCIRVLIEDRGYFRLGREIFRGILQLGVGGWFLRRHWQRVFLEIERRREQRKRAFVGEFEVSFSITLIQIFSHLFPILVCSSLFVNLGWIIWIIY